MWKILGFTEDNITAYVTSLQHKDLLWEFFEQQVVPAIQMYQMQSAPNCCPDEPTLSTGGITWLASLAGKEEKGRERREGEE